MGSGGSLTIPTLSSGAGTLITTGTGALTLTSYTVSASTARLDLSSGVSLSGALILSTFTQTFAGVSVTSSATLALTATTGILTAGTLTIPSTAIFSMNGGTIGTGTFTGAGSLSLNSLTVNSAVSLTGITGAISTPILFFSSPWLHDY